MKEHVEKPLGTKEKVDSFSRSQDNLYQLSHGTRLFLGFCGFFGFLGFLAFFGSLNSLGSLDSLYSVMFSTARDPWLLQFCSFLSSEFTEFGHCWIPEGSVLNLMVLTEVQYGTFRDWYETLKVSDFPTKLVSALRSLKRFRIQKFLSPEYRGRTFKVFVDLKTLFLNSVHLGENFWGVQQKTYFFRVFLICFL